MFLSRQKKSTALTLPFYSLCSTIVYCLYLYVIPNNKECKSYESNSFSELGLNISEVPTEIVRVAQSLKAN